MTWSTVPGKRHTRMAFFESAGPCLLREVYLLQWLGTRPSQLICASTFDDCIQNEGTTNLSFPWWISARLAPDCRPLGVAPVLSEEVLMFASNAGHPFKSTSWTWTGSEKHVDSEGGSEDSTAHPYRIFRCFRVSAGLSAFRFSSDILNGRVIH